MVEMGTEISGHSEPEGLLSRGLWPNLGCLPFPRLLCSRLCERLWGDALQDFQLLRLPAVAGNEGYEGPEVGEVIPDGPEPLLRNSS